MKDYSKIIQSVTTTPWMMEPMALKMMLEILEAHLNGDSLPVPIDEDYGSVGGVERFGPVGVLPLHGPIFPKANLMTELSGATSIEQFQKNFRELMADDSVDSIVMDIDSPGGSASMIPEMMDEIQRARQFKPIWAIANTAANSAAYGLAASADKFFASPSAQVGSVGTYLVHEDDTRQREAAGIDTTVIKAGRFKAMHIESLTPEMREHLQSFVDEMNDQFIDGIALGRRTTSQSVRENYGEGGIVTPSKALDTGMIDGIATFDQVVAKAPRSIGGGLFNTITTTTTSNTGGYALRQSYDADMEHSEPGTGMGGPPQPRTPPEEGDPAIEGGWRRDPPPIAYEEDLETEESAVNREWLEMQADTLGVEWDDTTDDESLSEAVATRIGDVVVPLNKATEAAQAQQEFTRLYPEHAARLARLEQKNREAEAHEFADSYTNFSAVAKEQIAEVHEAVANRQFDHAMLQSLVDTLSSEHLLVPGGEIGSSRQISKDRDAVPKDFRDARKMFADLVSKAMTEDSLSQDAAIQHVSEQNPELAKAYLYGHVGH